MGESGNFFRGGAFPLGEEKKSKQNPMSMMKSPLFMPNLLKICLPRNKLNLLKNKGYVRVFENYWESSMNSSMQSFLSDLFREDDLDRNAKYINSLPETVVNCRLKIKSDLVFSGTDYFVAAFNYLKPGVIQDNFLKEFEGQSFQKEEDREFMFQLPFNVALTGERIALNLIHRSCAISTLTKKYVDKASQVGISILDTRKTTPGLRALEKAAVTVGGGHNHRLGQTDMWMIKDNHKKIFGGLEKAMEFFKSMNSFYTPLLAEIHDISELQQAFSLGIKHVMLDNFSPDEVRRAIDLKPDGVTYEVSGGITLETMDAYLIQGVDAMSVGTLTSFPERVDLSLKMDPLS